MATINREKVYGSFTKNSDFAIYWALLRPVFMSISIFQGYFYLSNIKMSNNMLRGNILKFILSATV